MATKIEKALAEVRRANQKLSNVIQKEYPCNTVIKTVRFGRELLGMVSGHIATDGKLVLRVDSFSTGTQHMINPLTTNVEIMSKPKKKRNKKKEVKNDGQETGPTTSDS